MAADVTFTICQKCGVRYGYVRDSTCPMCSNQRIINNGEYVMAEREAFGRGLEMVGTAVDVCDSLLNPLRAKCCYCGMTSNDGALFPCIYKGSIFLVCIRCYHEKMNV